MKKLLYSATLLLALSCLFFSCKKENLQQSPIVEQAKSLKLNDGILEFASEKQLQETILFLKSLRTSGSLEDWENQWAGFKSMRTAYNSITEKDQEIIAQSNSAKGYHRFLSLVGEGDERQAVRNIMDDALATIVNHQGLLKIDGKFRLYRYDGLINFSNKTLVESSVLDDDFGSNIQQGISFSPIKRTYLV